MKLIALLMLLLTFSSTKQACAAGCLKCDSSSNCIVPDISQGYVLSNNAAVKASVTNCLVLNPDGTCTTCSTGYYLDATTKKCTAVPTAGAIANCSLYNTATSCLKCATGFYLNATACSAVTTTIANCQYYANATTCAACNSKYVLSLDAASCVSISSVANCSSYSYVSCLGCAATYTLNRNAYLNSNLAIDTAVQKTNLASFASNVVANSSALGQGACADYTAANCATFSVDTNTCTVCNGNYFLSSTGVCTIFPSEPILNCGVYTSATNCSQCVAGYLLSNNTCTAIATASLISNCATYNTSSSTVTCTACSANYYLSNNTCVQRSVSTNISNCATKTIGADTCAACATGYQLSTEASQCTANLANCTTHASYNANAALSCSVCASGYYTVTNATTNQVTCTQGTITNCATFAAGSNGATCSTCVNGYYLSANACVQQPTINNCSTYSNTANYCSTCNAANSFNFVLKKTCQNITGTVANCATYNDNAGAATLAAPNCVSCNSGFYLNASNTCTQITISNCLIMNANACTTCAAGYVLSFNALACIAPLTYISDQCQEGNYTASNSQTITNAACSICKQGSFPINFNSQYACISLSESAQFKNGTALAAADVGSCLKYDNLMNCVQCDPSATNKFLQTTGGNSSCVSTCTVGAYSKYTISTSNYQITGYNICKAANTVTGCAVYAPNLADAALADICIQCATGNIPVVASVSNTLAYSNADPNATADSNATLMVSTIPSPNATFLGVTCVAYANISQIGGSAVATPTSDPIANCSIYTGTGGNYSCLRCSQGYTAAPTTSSLITSCGATADATCAATKYYGLDRFIHSLASCHVCTDSTLIPIIAYTATSATNPNIAGFGRYNYTTLTAGTFADANSTTKSIVCRSPTTVTPAGNASWVITAFCGIGALLVNSDGTNNGTNLGNYCAACKPGYKATNNATYGWVKTCADIANCPKTGNLFNGCSACSSGYILAYDGTNVDFTTCVSIPAATASNYTNCYAATNTGGAAVECGVCKPGYNLNLDGVCDAVQPVNCAASAFRIYNAHTIGTINWSLYADGNSSGCNRCNSGYVAMLVNANRSVCLASSYISTTVDSMTNSDYVERCKTYDADYSAVRCLACQSGYVMKGTDADTPTYDACFINTSLSNCVIASSATVCQKCTNESYWLSSAGVCTLGAIANCIKYNFANSAGTVHTTSTCTQCAPDYYLSANACTLGTISNCARLTDGSATKCDTCATGFYRIVGSGSFSDYCYPNPTALNCSAFTLATNGNNTELTCTTCTNNASQIVAAVSATAVQTSCLSFFAVPNCSTFKVGATMATSDFTCTACAAGFYLANNKCTARTVKPAKCGVYNSALDLCTSCDSTSYVAADGKSCVDYPAGIYKCQTYSNATTCTACKSGFYLSSNACVAVPTAITNCSAYSSATQCSACASGYALTNNTCVQATATNCATYASATACATCPAGNVLTTSNSVTSCTALTKSGCATLDINSPNNCLTCNTGYFLNSGACSAATTIARCSAYASATTCSQCEAGYALSVDKATCTNTNLTNYLDANCNNSQLSSTPICSRCGAGRYFVNGACTGTCSGTGCLACSPSSNSTCYVCNTGYYQDSTGKCNAVSGNVDEGVSIFGVFSAVLMIIAVMFK